MEKVEDKTEALEGVWRYSLSRALQTVLVSERGSRWFENSILETNVAEVVVKGVSTVNIDG